MVGEDGHAEVDQLWPTVGPSPAEAVEVGGSGVEADLESFDFSEPAVAAGFADAVAEVLDDLDDAATLAGVDLEDRAADAGVFVLAGGSVGPSAGAEGHLAELEVLLEVLPLRRSRLAVFLLGTFGPAPVEEAPVGAHQVVLEDGKVCLGGGQCFVTKDDSPAQFAAGIRPGRR